MKTIGKALAVLAVTLELITINLRAQIVLDDFSTNDESKYNYLPVFNNPPYGWAVDAGQLRPTIGANAAGAWLWNQGAILSTVGDSVSITLSLPSGANNESPTSIGLFLAPQLDSAANGLEISVNRTSDGFYNVFWPGGGAVGVASTGSGQVQLSVEKIAPILGTTTYAVRLTGDGIQNPVNGPLFTQQGMLFFGPWAKDTAGSSVSLDNLTFTAVPEPRTYGLVFGFLALAIAAIRSRCAACA